jgi:hypothetical protein
MGVLRQVCRIRPLPFGRDAGSDGVRAGTITEGGLEANAANDICEVVILPLLLARLRYRLHRSMPEHSKSMPETRWTAARYPNFAME